MLRQRIEETVIAKLVALTDYINETAAELRGKDDPESRAAMEYLVLVDRTVKDAKYQVLFP